MVGCAIGLVSGEHVVGGKRDAVAAKERKKLLTKIPVAVMFGLVADIGADGIEVGTAHAEAAVTLLPAE